MDIVCQVSGGVMARPRKFDKQIVLTSAMEVFWRHGYEGTSTSTLEQATGLGRGSLYNAFGDKRGLYLCVLDHYADVYMGEAIQRIKGSDTSRLGIRALFQFVVEASSESSWRGGCLLCDAAIEKAPHDEDVAERVRRSCERLVRAIATMIASEQADRDEALIMAEANRALTTYMGLRVLARAGYPSETLSAIAESEYLA
ncbi:TetR/AcrR family transcriptional regulator [Halomonas huangheensis]|uniref:HTH tetR-type domain-containing protein n=1 Tax=Halomonas huangheensis TaxID=1178482 RepID=W1N9M0_9GAMM|nr:TetR/AcrR family transcriptional regulator [Halomonas huangheensis]ALM53857.1 hypothetical protein AR456_17435 [Halomonas huangheensis]ERL52204.1 hypothetical protein BJB45_09570 [Halomonas huangheensis]